MTHRHNVAVPTALLAIASAMLPVLAGCGPSTKSSAPPPPAAPKVSVIVMAPQRVALVTELPGRTSAVLVADVRPQITGLVQSRRFVEGSDVKAGQVLYQIAPETYRATLDSAVAAIAKAEANVRTSKLKVDRYNELIAIKAVSQQDADDALATLQEAVADVATAKATLQTARINLDFTRITSPIAGRIGKSTVTPGALVTSEQTTALATVQKIDPMYVDLTQSSLTLLRLKHSLAQGHLTSGSAPVRLTLEDGSPYLLTGTLKFSDVTVDTNTGMVTLRAEFPNPTGDLLPGMYVRALVEEGVDEKALLAPQPAVSRDAAGKPVAYVLTADNKLELRNLQTGRAVGNQWLVTDGLKAGDRLVVQGQQKAKVGAAAEAVAYVPAGAASAGSPAASGTPPSKALASADAANRKN